MIKLRKKTTIIAWYYTCDNSIVNEINNIINKTINKPSIYDDEYTVIADGDELILTHTFETSTSTSICKKGDYILFNEDNHEKLLVCNKEYLNKYERI